MVAVVVRNVIRELIFVRGMSRGRRAEEAGLQEGCQLPCGPRNHGGEEASRFALVLAEGSSEMTLGNM